MRTTVAIISAVLLLPWLARAQFVIDPYRFAFTFTTNTAVFDGTNDFIRRQSLPLTNIADGQTFTMVFWMKADVDATLYRILYLSIGSTTSKLRVFRTVGNQIEMVGSNAAGTTVLEATTTSTVTAAMGWVHVYIAIDLSSTSNRHIYFDGVEDASVTWTTYNTSGIIDLDASNPSTTIGADGSDNGKLAGALAEFWFDDTYFNDPTKFIVAGGPISLGANGNLPTGSAPVLYLSQNGSGDSWATDSSGNGNAFTVTGALGTTTPPP